MGWLVPVRPASTERIAEALRLVEEDTAAKTPGQEAEIDATLGDYSIEWEEGWPKTACPLQSGMCKEADIRQIMLSDTIGQ